MSRSSFTLWFDSDLKRCISWVVYYRVNLPLSERWEFTRKYVDRFGISQKKWCLQRKLKLTNPPTSCIMWFAGDAAGNHWLNHEQIQGYAEFVGFLQPILANKN